MPFIYQRTVRFSDTDAAGVFYFANVLTICHEAYEASLAATGVDLRVFFSGAEVALPIAHASVDFFRPMFCGDRLEVHLSPKLLQESEFELAYEVFLEGKLERSVSKATTRHVCIDPVTRSHEVFLEGKLERAVSKATTRHVCIDPVTRSRRSLPENINQWLKRWTMPA